ncbi:FecR family protein [Hyphococcus sp. DH-69]|uniref:FecR family protein n=1 Tax=Hyphococcus formosus TaxID=3143534 RepID=UPI00398A8356
MSDSGKVVEFPDRDEIRAEAANWFARVESREMTPDMRDELSQWLKSSHAHEEEFERLSGLWGDLDILEELNYLEVPDNPENRNILRLKTRPTRRVVFGIAASVAILAGLGSFQIFLNLRNPTQSEYFQTALGRQQTVQLIDGSTVTINTDSEINVQITRDARNVYLLKGEAHFDVASNPKRQFSVYAGDGIVRAIGTAFSVQVHDDDVEVFVSEGRVELIAKPEPVAEPASGAVSERVRVPNEKVPLTEIAAGDHARFNRDKLDYVAPMTEAEINRKLAWRHGMLAFAGEPLSEVIGEVSRYTDFQIEVAEPSLNKVPIGGYFKVGEVEGLLEALEETFDIKVERIDGNRARLRRET